MVENSRRVVNKRWHFLSNKSVRPLHAEFQMKIDVDWWRNEKSWFWIHFVRALTFDRTEYVSIQ